MVPVTRTPQAKRDDRSPVRQPQAGLWLAHSRQRMGIKIVWKACYRCGFLHPMLVRCLQSSGHKPGGFNHQKWILSQFWKPEVQTQGVTGPRSIGGSRAGSFLASSGFWCCHQSLACSCISLISASDLTCPSSLCACLCPNFLLLIGTPVTGFNDYPNPV